MAAGPVFPRIKTWVSNEVLTASDLNTEFNNLLNNTIPASIDDYSTDVATMQSTTDPGGVGTESLATTLAGEIVRLRYAIKRIIGGAQWYSTPVINLATTIGTSSIADGAVTPAKRAALGQQLSSSSGVYALTGGTNTAVTNLSVSITTTGRPVYVAVIHDGSANEMNLLASRSNIAYSIEAQILRDATIVYKQIHGARGDTLTLIYGNYAPPMIIDVVAAGTYTYTVKLQNVVSTNSAQVNMDYAKLIAFEL